MILKRGNLENLSGNAVVYWEVEGRNTLIPGFKVFAINFVISSLNLDDKLLTAIFPLTPFKDIDQLFTHLNNRECDIVYGGRLNIPEVRKDFKDFYRGEIQKYNELVEEYVGFYKNKVKIGKFSEIEKLYLLKNLIKKLHTLKEDYDEDQEINTRVNQIIDQLDKNAKYDVKQFRYLMKRSEMVSNQRNDVLNLYVDKFLAIYYEDYEKANRLKKKIKNLIE